MKKLKLLATFAIASVILISGCKKDEYQEKVGVCPLVVSTVPIDKAVNVPLNQVVSAIFNEKMNPATITQESFTLVQGTTPIAGTVSYSGLVASFAPASLFAPFTTYTGKVKTTVKDLMGNAIQTDFVWSFTTIPQVTLVSNPVIGGTTSGAGAFVQGSLVTVTGTPNVGYSFMNWTENGVIVSTNSSYQFTMAGNKTFVANFTLQYTVNLSANPVIGGITTGSGAYNAGASVTVTATPNAGFNFVNWTESGTIASTNLSYTFSLNASKTLVANFELKTYTLNVTAVNGTVLKVPSKTVYNSGEIVALTATPATGYTFTGWTGDATGLLNPLSVTMNANKAITANFTAIASGFTLNVTANNGTVVKNPDMVSYTSGATVLLTATPNSGYTFASWSGDATGSVNPLTVIMNTDKNITANFKADVIPPAGPLAIDLGCAAPFAILAGSTITSTGPSIITGNVGLSPGSALIGFPPGIINGTQEITTPIAAAAKLCLTTAYIDGQGRSLNSISLPGQLGGLTLAPGLYTNSSTSGISGTGANGILTLDAGGNSNAVWIFQMGSTLTTDPATSIVLAGGAQAANIFWIVGTSATLGTTSVFYGNILADQSITLKTGSVLNGRALTRIAAVTLDASKITKP
ncbi:MAG: ice-binding family protein [Bacteroidota bacterium]|nr:ice-binding family protein [Bacteroidota bacterium]